jgi:glycosyltransferase involved in cell wall biosynthesis
VVLEAQASGVPVVAFQAEGVCDIIQDERTGWLVQTGTQEEEAANFEKAIKSVVKETAKRQNASIEAIRWASGWQWSEAMEKAVGVYREAINRV